MIIVGLVLVVLSLIPFVLSWFHSRPCCCRVDAQFKGSETPARDAGPDVSPKTGSAKAGPAGGIAGQRTARCRGGGFGWCRSNGGGCPEAPD